MPDAPRLILFHLQGTSARLRFLCLPHGVLCFEPVPRPATVRENAHIPHAVRPLPCAWSHAACERLGLPRGAIEAWPDFFEEMLHADRAYPVLLARFTSIDPPFALAESLQARFLGLTEMQALCALERELLRRAYEAVMG